jgi:hypothetical protein
MLQIKLKPREQWNISVTGSSLSKKLDKKVLLGKFMRLTF